MSKVFNKKRIESIKKSKVKRYLVYAIGEILIVAIGIFLAIYLNNLQEEKSNQKYIDKILQQASKEAKRYIANSIYFMNYNARRDSLVHKILTNTVKLEDYNLSGKPNINALNPMIEFNFDNKPLENLNKRIDFLNKGEKKIYDLLSIIKTHRDGFKSISENAIEILNDYKKFQKENHEWFYLIEEDSIAIKKEFDYRFNSFEYKNFLRDYANYEINYKANSYTFFQFASFATVFRVMAVQTKQKLKANQVDSIFTSLNFKKLQKTKCDTTYEKAHTNRELFNGINLYSVVYNASKDTIVVKNDNGKVLESLASKAYSAIQVPNGSTIQVFIGEKCVAKYKTEINSYFFYK